MLGFHVMGMTLAHVNLILCSKGIQPKAVNDKIMDHCLSTLCNLSQHKGAGTFVNSTLKCLKKCSKKAYPEMICYTRTQLLCSYEMIIIHTSYSIMISSLFGHSSHTWNRFLLSTPLFARLDLR